MPYWEGSAPGVASCIDRVTRRHHSSAGQPTRISSSDRGEQTGCYQTAQNHGVQAPIFQHSRVILAFTACPPTVIGTSPNGSHSRAHPESFFTPTSDEPIRVWCYCAIGEPHTYHQWIERFQRPAWNF